MNFDWHVSVKMAPRSFYADYTDTYKCAAWKTNNKNRDDCRKCLRNGSRDSLKQCIINFSCLQVSDEPRLNQD